MRLVGQRGEDGGGRLRIPSRVSADPAADTVTVNGRTYSGKVFVERGRTYVPLRTTVTALGGGIAWDPYLGGAAVTSPGAEHDAADLYWLSRIISAESRGETMDGSDRRGQCGAEPGGGRGVP